MLGIFVVLILLIAHASSTNANKQNRRMIFADCSEEQIFKSDARIELLLAYDRQIANIEGKLQQMAIDAEKSVDMHNTKRLDAITEEMDKLDLKMAKIKVQREKLQNQIDKKRV